MGKKIQINRETNNRLTPATHKPHIICMHDFFFIHFYFYFWIIVIFFSAFFFYVVSNVRTRYRAKCSKKTTIKKGGKDYRMAQLFAVFNKYGQIELVFKAPSRTNAFKISQAVRPGELKCVFLFVYCSKWNEFNCMCNVMWLVLFL